MLRTALMRTGASGARYVSSSISVLQLRVPVLSRQNSSEASPPSAISIAKANSKPTQGVNKTSFGGASQRDAEALSTGRGRSSTPNLSAGAGGSASADGKVNSGTLPTSTSASASRPFAPPTNRPFAPLHLRTSLSPAPAAAGGVVKAAASMSPNQTSSPNTRPFGPPREPTSPPSSPGKKAQARQGFRPPLSIVTGLAEPASPASRVAVPPLAATLTDFAAAKAAERLGSGGFKGGFGGGAGGGGLGGGLGGGTGGGGLGKGAPQFAARPDRSDRGAPAKPPFAPMMPNGSPFASAKGPPNTAPPPPRPPPPHPQGLLPGDGRR